MGWGYLSKGSQGKPWAKRSAEDRYESKAERFAKLRQVQAQKKAQAVSDADRQAKRIERELAAKRRSEAQAKKAAMYERVGGKAGGALHVSMGKALDLKHGPTGRPAASEIGPRVAYGPAVAPPPNGYAQMKAAQAASARKRSGQAAPKAPVKPVGKAQG